MVLCATRGEDPKIRNYQQVKEKSSKNSALAARSNQPQEERRLRETAAGGRPGSGER